MGNYGKVDIGFYISNVVITTIIEFVYTFLYLILSLTRKNTTPLNKEI